VATFKAADEVVLAIWRAAGLLRLERELRIDPIDLRLPDPAGWKLLALHHHQRPRRQTSRRFSRRS
jgi:hypothetical protein